MSRAICFDLFNTLVNVGSVPTSIGGTNAEVLGVEASAWNQACFSDDHEICHPTNHFDVIRTLAHRLDPKIPLTRIHDATRQRQARFDYALTTHVSPDVVNALRKLRDQGYQIALISNASTAEVQAWPDSPLRPLFDVSVFSCDVGMKKPDPAIYYYTAEQLGVDAQHCVFVGDGGSDEHHGAHASGMTPLWLTCHLKADTIARLQPKLQDKIVETCTSLDEMADWLAK
ncbi:MAG: HAD family hydrolase [Gammaproteobacteria bacterium]|nr:HAD family hydrolase [Gammaproteobacteria bacterium]